jgi:hypothetical protein
MVTEAMPMRQPPRRSDFSTKARVGASTDFIDAMATI